MKFMMMMHAPRVGWKDAGIGTWPPADIQAHIAFMMRFNQELAATRRARRRAGPGAAGGGQGGARGARVGEPVVTDGPFPEAKEFLAGYWIVDVESAARALPDRRPGFGGPGQGRRADEHADRGAPGDEQAARGPVTAAMPVTARRSSAEQLLRELAPQVLGAVIRRFGDFAAAEDAVQEALLAAAMQWPRAGRAREPARAG